MPEPGEVTGGRSLHGKVSPSTSTLPPPAPSAAPREENSLRRPCLSPEATVTIHGAFLKLPVIVHSPAPELPAEITTIMPRSESALVATLVGSAGSNGVHRSPVLPNEFATTRMP